MGQLTNRFTQIRVDGSGNVYPLSALMFKSDDDVSGFWAELAEYFCEKGVGNNAEELILKLLLAIRSNSDHFAIRNTGYSYLLFCECINVTDNDLANVDTESNEFHSLMEGTSFYFCLESFDEECQTLVVSIKPIKLDCERELYN